MVAGDPYLGQSGQQEVGQQAVAEEVGGELRLEPVLALTPAEIVLVRWRSVLDTWGRT